MDPAEAALVAEEPGSAAQQQQQGGSVQLLDLPSDVMGIIFRMIDMKSVISASQVCKSWSETVWLAQSRITEVPWLKYRNSGSGLVRWGSLQRCENLTALNLALTFTVWDDSPTHRPENILELPNRVDVAALKRLTRLESLVLSGNAWMSDAHIDALSCLTRLKMLDLEASTLPTTCSKLSAVLLSMPHLVSLNLRKFNDSMDAEHTFCNDVLLKLTNLEEIRLPEWAPDWEALRSLPKLHRLFLPQTMLTNFGFMFSNLQAQIPRLAQFPKTNFLLPHLHNWSLLGFCVRANNIEAVDILLQHSRDFTFCNPNVADVEGCTPLMLCRTIEIADRLLAAGADINAVGYPNPPTQLRQKTNALLEAVASKNVEYTRFLLQKGASVANCPRSPIFVALLNEDGPMVDLLVRHSPSLLNDTELWPRSQDKQITVTPLLLAIKVLEVHYIKTVFHFATDDALNKLARSQRDRIGKRSTPLHTCVSYEDDSIIDTLLDHGADINAVDDMGYTPLWMALNSGNAARVRLLLRGKPLTPALNVRHQYSCLGLAFKYGMLKLVAESISNFTLEDFTRDPVPVLYYMLKFFSVEAFLKAITKEDDISILRDRTPADFVHLFKNVDLNNPLYSEHDGRSHYPLIGALKNGDSRAAKFFFDLLLLCGARLNVKDSHGVPTIILACRYIEILRAVLPLLQADINVPSWPTTNIGLFPKSRECHSVLTYACCDEDCEVVDALLEAGANPNLPNSYGNTPLNSALTWDTLDLANPTREALADAERIVGALLKHGADPNLADSNGYTPITRVLLLPEPYIPLAEPLLRLLLDHGAIPPSASQSAPSGKPTDRGAKTRRANSAPMTCLIFALTANMSLSTVQKILDAAPELVNQAGFGPLPPLLFACDALASLNSMPTKNQTDVIKLLVERGAKIRPKLAMTDETALGFAILLNRIDLCELFINAFRKRQEKEAHQGADILELVVNTAADTPLQFAIKRGHLQIVKLLLRLGAPINSRSKNSSGIDYTPLELAISKRNADIVKELLTHSADAKSLSRQNSSVLKQTLKACVTPQLGLHLIPGPDLINMVTITNLLMRADYELDDTECALLLAVEGRVKDMNDELERLSLSPPTITEPAQRLSFAIGFSSPSSSAHTSRKPPSGPSSKVASRIKSPPQKPSRPSTGTSTATGAFSSPFGSSDVVASFPAASSFGAPSQQTDQQQAISPPPTTTTTFNFGDNPFASPKPQPATSPAPTAFGSVSFGANPSATTPNTNPAESEPKQPSSSSLASTLCSFSFGTNPFATPTQTDPNPNPANSNPDQDSMNLSGV